MGAELFHADGQTRVTKLLVAFRNFTNAPQNSKQLHAALPWEADSVAGAQNFAFIIIMVKFPTPRKNWSKYIFKKIFYISNFKSGQYMAEAWGGSNMKY